MTTTTHEGRTYQLEVMAEPLSAAHTADMIARGWNPIWFNGTSAPVGRQRKTMGGLFYQSAKTGQFVKIM